MFRLTGDGVVCLLHPVDADCPQEVIVPINSIWVSPAHNFCVVWNWLDEDGTSRNMIYGFKVLEPADIILA